MRFGQSAALFCVAVLCFHPSSATADPITVISGWAQTTASPLMDFRFETAGVDVAGSNETGQIPPFLRSGFSGDVVNLSSTYVGPLNESFVVGEFDPLGTCVSDCLQLAAGRVDFRFAAGDVAIPSVEDALSQYGAVFAPFTFVGQVFGYTSNAEMLSGAAPVVALDLIGSGTAEALFHLQNPEGIPLIDQPLVNYSIIYRFDGGSAAIPEPSSLLLIGTGLLGVCVWRRRQRKAS